jgi:hypothetical protein
MNQHPAMSQSEEGIPLWPVVLQGWECTLTWHATPQSALSAQLREIERLNVLSTQDGLSW